MGFCAPASTEHGHLSVISATTSTFASVPSVTCGYVSSEDGLKCWLVSLIMIMQKSYLLGTVSSCQHSPKPVSNGRRSAEVSYCGWRLTGEVKVLAFFSFVYAHLRLPMSCLQRDVVIYLHKIKSLKVLTSWFSLLKKEKNMYT